MAKEMVTINGVLRGKTIELDRDPGLPDGQAVRVTMEPSGRSDTLAVGEGLKRAFGAWADDSEEVDKYLEWNRQQRKRGRRELEP
jgi:hypothetical protein